MLLFGKLKAPAIVFPSTARLLGFVTLLFQQVWRAITFVRVAIGQQLVRNFPMATEALSLKVRGVRATNFRSFIPVESKPVHRLEYAGNHVLGRPFRVGVLDAENERSAVVARKEPVEQCRPCAPNVEIPRGRRRESDARRQHRRILSRAVVSSLAAEPLRKKRYAISSLFLTAARSPSVVTTRGSLAERLALPGLDS